MEKRTRALDVAFLVLTVSTFAVAAGVIFLAGPDSWFHRERNSSLSLLLGALSAGGLLNLRIAAAHGKIWIRTGPVYRDEHPRVFALGRSLARLTVLAGLAGIAALLLFLPPI